MLCARLHAPVQRGSVVAAMCGVVGCGWPRRATVRVLGPVPNFLDLHSQQMLPPIHHTLSGRGEHQSTAVPAAPRVRPDHNVKFGCRAVTCGQDTGATIRDGRPDLVCRWALWPLPILAREDREWLLAEALEGQSQPLVYSMEQRPPERAPPPPKVTGPALV